MEVHEAPVGLVPVVEVLLPPPQHPDRHVVVRRRRIGHQVDVGPLRADLGAAARVEVVDVAREEDEELDLLGGHALVGLTEVVAVEEGHARG